MRKRRGRRPAPGAVPLNVPNVLSLLRMASVPVLWAALWSGERTVFTWVLLAALLSDIADGLIARLWSLHTEVGAFLDSTADLLVTVTAVAGLFAFQADILHAHRHGLWTVIVFYLATVVTAYARYGRLAALHTYLARAAAYAGGIWIMSLFFWGFQGWLYAVMVCLYVVESVEELAIMALVRRWTPDARGLWWVLRR